MYIYSIITYIFNLHYICVIIRINSKNKMKDETTIEVTYLVLSNDRKGRYIAYSPHLKLVGFGKTIEEAESDFDVAISDFFSFHKQQGTLHAKLINLGYKLNGNTYKMCS